MQDDGPQNNVELLSPPDWRDWNIFGKAFYVVGLAAVLGGLYWFSEWAWDVLTALFG